jgi:hypothetical protein
VHIYPAAVGKVHRKIGIVFVVVDEIIPDLVSLIIQCQDKFLEPVCSIMFHDVLQDGFPSNFHHGFGLVIGFFTQAHTMPAAEDDDFHIRIWFYYYTVLFSNKVVRLQVSGYR